VHTVTILNVKFASDESLGALQAEEGVVIVRLVNLVVVGVQGILSIHSEIELDHDNIQVVC